MIGKRTLILALGAASCIGACDLPSSSWRTANMTPLTPRLESMLEKTKTVCFGRFLIDVPATARVAWGQAKVPWQTSLHLDGHALLTKWADEDVTRLKSERNIFHNKPLLVADEAVEQPTGRVVTSYQDFQSQKGLWIYGFFLLPPLLLYIKAQDFTDAGDHVRADILDIARRMRLHAESDVPREPGLCIEHGFLPDQPGPPKSPPEPEHIRIGFRLAEFPDTHLSIYVAPANRYDTTGDSLEVKLERTEADARKAGRGDPYAGITFFRRARRQIGDWDRGFEILTRTPDEAVSIAHHDFWMKFEGTGGDVLRPFADIQMKTGIAETSAGAVRPALTDAETVALWDKLTGSIRVRPATAPAPSKTSAVRTVPLGDLQATGRRCPQSGWWECIDAGVLPDSRRVQIRAGQPMPSTLFHARPTLWQKLAGDRPIARRATVWKLVAYDDEDDPAAR